MNADSDVAIKSQSLWWRDILSFGNSLDNRMDWFASGVKLRQGNGCKVSFWSDIWLGSESLMLLLQRLYTVTAEKNCHVAEGVWFDGRWRWELNGDGHCSSGRKVCTQNCRTCWQELLQSEGLKTCGFGRATR
jgi:hypothetical protein